MNLREPALKPEIHHRLPTRHLGKTRINTHELFDEPNRTAINRDQEAYAGAPIPRLLLRENAVSGCKMAIVDLKKQKKEFSRVGLVTSGARTVSTVSDATPVNMTRRKRHGERRKARFADALMTS